MWLLTALATVLWLSTECSAFELPCNPACGENGRCVADHGNLSCRCDLNWYGDACNIFICEENNPCGDGLCFRNSSHSSAYQCSCPFPTYGEHCEFTAESDVCTDDSCRGQGFCHGKVANSSDYYCTCSQGYYGTTCQYSGVDPCDSQDCFGHGECYHEQKHGSAVAACRCHAFYFESGFCQHKQYHICETSPCMNGGNCSHTSMSPVDYICDCPPEWTGRNCTTRFDVCEGHCGNGVCEAIADGHYFRCTCLEGYSGPECEVVIDTTDQPVVSSETTPTSISCPEECGRLANDGQCHRQCNTAACGFDGSDCGGDPYRLCPTPSECRQSYRDGRCNVSCNRRECLYDGGDCLPERTCLKREQCEAMLDDGHCQLDCLTFQCPYDFVDCGTRASNNLLSGRLLFELVSRDERPFTSPWREEFLGNLSVITNSVARLVSSWMLTPKELAERNLNVDITVYRVVVKLDTSECTDQCPRTTEEGLRNVEVAISHGVSLGPYTVKDIDVEGDPKNSDIPAIASTVSIILLLLVVVAVIGILLGKRRKIRAKIWRPTSPSDTDHASPSSLGANGIDGATSSMTKAEEAGESYIEMGTKKAKMESDERHIEWEDDTVPLSSDAASSPTKKQLSKVVIGQSGRDGRQWNIAHARDVGRLVEQYRRQNGTTPNVNIPGPGGFTPLMLAVMRRPGAADCIHYQSRSSSESSSDDQTALLPPMSRGAPPRHMVISPVDRSVASLIDAKANLDAVNDYGQSAIHLSAGASNPASVDMLLEAGANPNIPDNWGQTSLHAAIGAGAEGAFMILLSCPRTKVNVKSDGGITPLMSAVKMVNTFMVKQLLKKDTDAISSTDSEGRTAVHWAAMVDNYEALRELISRGSDTIKDAQDNKGQTALFLACREGAFRCVRHLLDCFANVTLLDHLDQSPVQVAMQKQYMDIVDLLRANAHGPMPYVRQMAPGNGTYNFSASNGYPASSQQQQQQLITPPAPKKKKKGRTQSPTNSYLTSSVSHASPPDQYNPPPSVNYSNPTPPGAFSNPNPTPPGVYSNPNPTPPGAYANPTPPGGYSDHTPPGGYSNPTPPGGYSNPTPPGGYSNHPTPPYDHQHSMQAEDMASVTTPTVSGVTPLQHPSILESSNYAPMYPSSAAPTDVMATNTRPLQHMGTDQSTAYGPTDGGFIRTDINSPPQSGGSVTQSSPSMFPSPPNTNSPGSQTPSPEARQTTSIHTQGMVYVEPNVGMGGVMGGVNFIPHVPAYQHRHHQLTPV